MCDLSGQTQGRALCAVRSHCVLLRLCIQTDGLHSLLVAVRCVPPRHHFARTCSQTQLCLFCVGVRVCVCLFFFFILCVCAIFAILPSKVSLLSRLPTARVCLHHSVFCLNLNVINLCAAPLFFLTLPLIR